MSCHVMVKGVFLYSTALAIKTKFNLGECHSLQGQISRVDSLLFVDNRQDRVQLTIDVYTVGSANYSWLLTLRNRDSITRLQLLQPYCLLLLDLLYERDSIDFYSHLDIWTSRDECRTLLAVEPTESELYYSARIVTNQAFRVTPCKESHS